MIIHFPLLFGQYKKKILLVKRDGIMIYKKGMLILIVLSIFLVGAWTPFGSHKQTMDHVLTNVDSYVEQQQWSKAQSEADQFTRIYKKEKWLLQLMGDEGEYEGLNHSIDKLKAALKTKSDTQSKMEIANIKAILEEIFSL